MMSRVLGIVLLILMNGMSACTTGDKASWKEEVLLHDGSKIVVQRSITRKGRHEPFNRLAIGEQRLSFRAPSNKRRVIWKDG